MRAPGDLTPDEHEMLTVICQASPTAAHLYDLVQGFRQLVHRQEGRSFDDWCRQVEQSAIGELHRFVRGLTRDDAAVRAGLTQATNNGMVEGFITKLKLIKRMMFGRATFPLLRQRVLHME